MFADSLCFVLLFSVMRIRLSSLSFLLIFVEILFDFINELIYNINILIINQFIIIGGAVS